MRAPTAAGLLALLVAAPLDAQKTDVVVLRNGDRITGEIKRLARGLLSVSTDDMGTLAIEWDNVARVTSQRYFEVETQSGVRRFGALGAGARDGSLVVERDTLRTVSVVRINRIRAGFWDRLDGYVDLGFTFQQASSVIQLSASASATYRSEAWLTTLRANSFLQGQEDAERLSRNSAFLQGQRFLGHRWSGIAFAQVEQNEELGLRLRTLLGGGAANLLRQSNTTLVQAAAGLSFTSEWFAGDTDPSATLEGLLSVGLGYFRLDHPTTDLRVDLKLYPGIAESGRLRGNLDARLAHEAIRDFTVGLTLFETFDTRPPDAGLANNDLGVTLTLGWNF